MSAGADCAHAYVHARYRIRCAAQGFVRRIGVVDARCDGSLRAAGCRHHWYIITPCNPKSRMLSAADNAARLHALRQQLQASGARYLETLADADDGQWPEAGFCIFDLTEPAARALGRQFDQSAIVVGELDRAPHLLWLQQADCD